jgi:hypothetical protein
MVDEEAIGIDARMRARYRRIAMVFLVIAIVFTVWTMVVVVSIFMLQVGGGWTILTPTEWVLANIVVVAVFLVLDALIYVRYRAKTRSMEPPAVKERRLWRGRKEKTPAPELIHGREVYTVTLPPGAQGGIFSKTFVPIDDNRVLQLRYQMIPPMSLWPSQQQ